MPPLTCGTESFNNATTVAPRILLVVDRSKSMDNAATGFAGSKWEATQSTMSNVVSSLSNECEFGLMLYPNDETSLCGPATFPVAVSASGAAQVVSTLNATSAFGATPTASALRAAKTALDGMSGTGGTRAVILTTDGAPNCNSGANANTCTCTPGTSGCSPTNPPGATTTINRPANCIDEDPTAAAAREINDAGYPVFVVGITGVNGFESVMNRLAVEGGTALGGTTKFYSASSSNLLADALEDAAVRLMTCRFDLSAPADAANITVRKNNVGVARDASRSDGWDLVDSDTIELFGNACGIATITIDACR